MDNIITEIRLGSIKRHKHQDPWIDNGIVAVISTTKLLGGWAKDSKTTQDKLAYEKARNKSLKAVRKAKKNVHSEARPVIG